MLRRLAAATGLGAAAPAAPVAPVSVDRALAEHAISEGLAGLVLRCGHPSPDAVPILRAAWAKTSIGVERALRGAREALAGYRRPILWLKGAALAHAVYQPGDRDMADVDVLVEPRFFDEACAAVERAGGRRHAPRGRLITARGEYAAAFVLPDTILEVHRALAAPPLWPVDAGALMERASSGGGLLVPSAEDLFLMLAIHAAKHGWAVPFRALIDGAMVTARLAPDPARLRVRAHEARAGRALSIYAAALEAYGLPAPPSLAGPLARALAARHPWIGERDKELAPVRWARVALAQDDAWRPLAWAAGRAALRLADALRA